MKSKCKNMSTNDPLGILALQERMNAAIVQLDKLEQFMLQGTELPVSEAKIIEKTGIRTGTLLSLRQEGKIRSYKAGKVVMYLPSEFTEDIKNLI